MTVISRPRAAAVTGWRRRSWTRSAGEREPRPAGEWLPFLGRTAAGDVGRRLAGAGYLTRGAAAAVARRAVGAGRLRLRVHAAQPGAVGAGLRPPVPAVHAAVLAGLAAACGLGTRLLAYAPPALGRRSPQEAAALLPSRCAS